MLVLSRHRNEAIIIPLPGGEQIKITVVDIRGNKTRLGIDAPPHLTVDREEVHLAKTMHIPTADTVRAVRNNAIKRTKSGLFKTTTNQTATVGKMTDYMQRDSKDPLETMPIREVGE